MERSCIVTGGSSQIGSWLVPKLIETGWNVKLISRGVRPQIDHGSNATWHTLDLRNPNALFPAMSAQVLFHTAGIASVLPWIGHFSKCGVSRIVAISSTSLLTKTSSEDSHDMDVVKELRDSESALIEQCEAAGITWTILRPTLIYGGKHGDRTVDDIAKTIRRFGFFPLFGGGTGLRQPVHADDLAQACMLVIDNDKTANRAYNLGGGEQLRYSEMIKRIFAAMGRRPFFVRTPIWVFDLVVRVANMHPRYRHLTSSMAKRMQLDMAFSTIDAQTDFGYSPRKFLPRIA